ncbi:MAG: hypothetical protein H8E20_08345 [Verrucomicrobia bacterium]|nr:hypothetical protein [Verrucomicrobiota bacterium]
MPKSPLAVGALEATLGQAHSPEAGALTGLAKRKSGNPEWVYRRPLTGSPG